MKNIRRFTLVELLVVMALIAILSGFGFGVYSYSKTKAKQSSTEALLKQIDAGLSALKSNGQYPASTGTGFNVIKFEVNDTDGTVSKIDFGGETLAKQTGNDRVSRLKNERMEAFIKAVDMEVIKNQLNAGNELVDAWGNPIYYRSPGQFNKGGYDLVSAGPDGVFGKNGAAAPAGTDVTIFRETTGGHLCDDVFTF